VTLIRVYRAFRREDGTVRIIVSRDPANGAVSPIDYRWWHREPQVGDTVDLPGHEGRTVTIKERHWHGDDGALHLTAISISTQQPDRP